MPTVAHTIHSRTSARRARALVALAAALALIATLFAVLPAQSASAADPTRGWVRLAHLSPDTRAVDIRVTDASGAQVLELEEVGYGIVSPYAALPAGGYRATLVPAGSAPTAKPVLTADFEVVAGTAASALVHGKNAEIRATVLVDDLTRPSEDAARIRVVQMSAGVPAVDVATSTGMAVAKKLRRGAATPYLEVPAGPWTLNLRATGQAASVDVVASEATSSTLFVVDTADGGLAMLPVLDSAATDELPVGAIPAGGGWLANQKTADVSALLVRIGGAGRLVALAR